MRSGFIKLSFILAIAYFLPGCSNISEGTFVDSRDGQHYRWVRFNQKIWMAQNLNYAPYGYDSANVAHGIYTGKENYLSKHNDTIINGSYYTWAAALNIDRKYDSMPFKFSGESNKSRQCNCPDGWHLPSKDDWNELSSYPSASFKTAKVWNAPTDSWRASSTPELINNQKFSIYPSGRFSGNYWEQQGSIAPFWISSRQDSLNADYVVLSRENDSIALKSYSKTFAHPVRCIRNQLPAGLVIGDRLGMVVSKSGRWFISPFILFLIVSCCYLLSELKRRYYYFRFNTTIKELFEEKTSDIFGITFITWIGAMIVRGVIGPVFSGSLLLLTLVSVFGITVFRIIKKK
jgi:uncharacterized protein (TIGR02145 family)